MGSIEEFISSIAMDKFSVLISTLRLCTKPTVIMTLIIIIIKKRLAMQGREREIGTLSV